MPFCLHEVDTERLCTSGSQKPTTFECAKGSPCNAEIAGLIPGSRRSLEEEMATHSSIFAWSIPWAEEPGGLQSIGSHRVGCNRACAECGKLLTTQILAAAPEFPIQSFGGGA